MPELLHIPYSPWSEQARWALDAAGVAYTARVYQPVLGELGLRRMLGQWRGPVSVPVLRDGDRVIAGALGIARYADAHATGTRLFPPGEEDRVQHYAALGERGMEAGRALVMRRVMASPAALESMVPRALRRVPALARAIGGLGARYIHRKYGGHRDAPATQERVLVEVLDALRYGLSASASRSEPRTLLWSLSYADITMAQVLVCVRPPSIGLRMSAASRAAFELPGLAERYADLLGWRDALYAHHRQPRT